MRTTTFLRKSLTHYWRTNLAVVLGIAVATSVLAGALLVGSSVRASLRDLAVQRLGNTDFVVSSASFFREQLSDQLSGDEKFKQSFNSLCPMIALDGMVIYEPSGRRAYRIQVYGIDERFWKFHGIADKVKPLGDREALLSPSLAQELSASAGENIVLRVQKPSAIPIESLQGRKDDPGRAIRLTVRDTLPTNQLGEFSLRPSQGAVRAIFVPLRRLQKDLQLDEKINTILLSNDGRGDIKADSATRENVLRNLIKDSFTLNDLGLRIRSLTNPDGISVESDSAMLNDDLAKKVDIVATRSKLESAPVFTYLVNSIRIGDKAIPYSLVTAVDLNKFSAQIKVPKTTDDDVSESNADHIFLNKWAADELGAKPGDNVTLEYYLWQDGQQVTRTADFKLAAILPMQGGAIDRTLTPEYPGITESTSIADWDPPFPINLKRIRPDDEQYWKQYRTAPKAFIDLKRGQQLWGSRFGNFTSLRLTKTTDASTEWQQSFSGMLRDSLDPMEYGFYAIPVKLLALDASQGATDFGEYFAYFSFSIVVSALLLAGLFFKLGIEQRSREIGLLRAVGFSIAKIRALFLLEGFALSIIGNALGIAGALLYAGLMLLGLRTWWIGAIGTNDITLHVSITSLLAGAIGGLLVALGFITWTLRKLGNVSPRSLLTGIVENRATSSSKKARIKLNGKIIGSIFLILGFLLLARRDDESYQSGCRLFWRGHFIADCGVVFHIRVASGEPSETFTR